MRSLPEIMECRGGSKAMNAAVVDRNVTVHLRARQADIYEKALRNMIKRGGPATEDCEALLYIAQKALERAERIR